jgi:hypothetical protein
MHHQFGGFGHEGILVAGPVEIAKSIAFWVKSSLTIF